MPAAREIRQNSQTAAAGNITDSRTTDTAVTHPDTNCRLRIFFLSGDLLPSAAFSSVFSSLSPPPAAVPPAFSSPGAPLLPPPASFSELSFTFFRRQLTSPLPAEASSRFSKNEISLPMITTGCGIDFGSPEYQIQDEAGSRRQCTKIDSNSPAFIAFLQIQIFKFPAKPSVFPPLCRTHRYSRSRFPADGQNNQKAVPQI